MRKKDVFSFTGNNEPGIPFDSLDVNSPSYHELCDNLRTQYLEVRYRAELYILLKIH
jgi:hypothetical protein